MAEGHHDSVVNRAFERAYAWFAEPRDCLPMSAARAGLGATLAMAYAQYAAHQSFFWGPDGLAGHDMLARHPNFSGLSYEWFARLRVLHTIGSPTVVTLLYGLLVLSALAFCAGFKTRFFGVLAAALHMVFFAHSPHVDGGWPALMGPFIIYLTLCDAGADLSVDAWLRRRRETRDGSRANARDIVLRAPWGMRLLQVHLCTMYLSVGFERLSSPGWTNGEMVLRSLASSTYGRFDVDWFAATAALHGVSYAVFILEPAAPLLLWVKPVSRWWALALIGMHLSLEILLDTGWWQPMMISALLTFVPAAWLRRLMPKRDATVQAAT